MPDDLHLAHRERVLSAATLAWQAPTDANRKALSDAVCHLVTYAKEQDDDITQILVRVKQILREAGLSRRTDAAADAAVQHVVTACIEHFYRPGTPPTQAS